MAWDAENLMFDPSSVSGQPRTAAPTTQGIAQQQPTRPLNQPPMQQQRNPGDQAGVTLTMDPANGGDIWARIQQAAKAGLITQAQAEAAAKKLGYGQQQPDIAGNGKDVASNFGSTVGGIVGGAGRAIYDRATAPAQPGAPLSIGPEYPGGPQPPSPAWNN